MPVSDNALVSRIEALESELEAVRRAVRTKRAPGTGAPGVRPTDLPSAVSDRRGVVKLLAASAVGAVAGATLHGQHAVADDGQPVVQGQVNNATSATFLNASNDSALSLYSDNGYGLESDGVFGNALFIGGGSSPVGGPAWAGTLWIDGDGNWWAATHSDVNDGQWRKLAGPGTSGALHLLPAPTRVYDSRPGEPPAIGPKSRLEANTPLTIDPKQNASAVPAEARGVLITLTIADASAVGFATVWPSGPWPGTSNINFGAGQNIATTTVVGVAPGASFLVLANVSTEVLIDVVGYYV